MFSAHVFARITSKARRWQNEVTMRKCVAVKQKRQQKSNVLLRRLTMQPGHSEPNPRRRSNNTYKAIRVLSEEYNLYYSVWCNNERELYDLRVS